MIVKRTTGSSGCSTMSADNLAMAAGVAITMELMAMVTEDQRKIYMS
jgi:hypothetical protein